MERHRPGSRRRHGRGARAPGGSPGAEALGRDGGRHRGLFRNQPCAGVRARTVAARPVPGLTHTRRVRCHDRPARRLLGLAARRRQALVDHRKLGLSRALHRRGRLRLPARRVFEDVRVRRAPCRRRARRAAGRADVRHDRRPDQRARAHRVGRRRRGADGRGPGRPPRHPGQCRHPPARPRDAQRQRQESGSDPRGRDRGRRCRTRRRPDDRPQRHDPGRPAPAGG